MVETYLMFLKEALVGTGKTAGLHFKVFLHSFLFECLFLNLSSLQIIMTIM